MAKTQIRSYGDPPSQRFTVHLLDQRHRQLKKRALVENKPMSEIVREAIDLHLDRKVAR